MAEPEVVFDNTVDAFFRRALGKRMTESCRARLKEAGIDLDRKLEPTYPRVTFYRGVVIAVEELFGGMSRENGLFRAGEAFFSGYAETLIGRAAVAVTRVLGPRRTLARMTQNFRSSNNYMETHLTELSPTHTELWLSQVSGVPTYFQGILTRAFALVEVKGAEIKIQKLDGSACTFELSWREK
jgi:uncharacterized protein (TIGR02265 family)